MRVGIPKLFWWIRYDIDGKFGMFPRSFRTQELAQEEAMRRLGSSHVHYGIYPLETKDVHTAARRLKAIISKSNEASNPMVRGYNAPPLGMRF